jgi:hypothetical protein
MASPQERLASARAAAEQKQLDAYLLHFTAQSAEILRGLHDTWSRTKGNYGYTKDIFKLLPEGEITEEMDRGPAHLIKLGQKQKEVELTFLKEHAVWVIDGMQLPGLWQPMVDNRTEGAP